MKPLFIVMLCALAFSSCTDKSVTCPCPEPVPQVVMEPDTMKKTDMAVPSVIVTNLFREARFHGEKFDTSENRYPGSVARSLSNEHFEITIQYSGEESGYYVVIEDKFTNLFEDRSYYKDHHLYQVEYELNRYSLKSLPVGVWKYYGKDGGLDHITDYDIAFPITYTRAVEIAGTKGYVAPGLLWGRDTVGGRVVWEVIRECGDFDTTPDAILIDAHTGAINIPDSVDCSPWHSDVSKG